MRFLSILIFAAGFCLASVGSVRADLLQEIRERGYLRCGVYKDISGFSNGTTEIKGFDVDMCRALAAGILGKATALDLKSYDADMRFDALLGGEIDVLFGTTTWNMQRDVGKDLMFPAIVFFDGQGFTIHKKLGVKTLDEVFSGGKYKICVRGETTLEDNLRSYIQQKKAEENVTVVALQSNDGAKSLFLRGECDMLTTELANLYTDVTSGNDADNFVFFPDIISKEPLSAVVKASEAKLFHAVRNIVNVLIASEEASLSSENVGQAYRASAKTSSQVREILQGTAETAKAIGLPNDWAYQAILQVGNYGEVFSRNLGDKSVFKMKRGLNALVKDGGLIYAPPLQ